MFKKSFFFLFVLFSIFSFYNKASAAFFLDNGGSNTCDSKLINATATNIISKGDLSGLISVCVVAGTNLPIILNENRNPSGFSTSTQINTSGTTTITVPYSFDISSLQGSETITFDVSDSNANTDRATIIAYIPIYQIGLTNNQSVNDNGTLGAGKTITFTCTNSDEMYYDPVANATNTPIVSDYTGATGYTLVYQVTPTPGNHVIECDNIAGGLTRQVFHFYANNYKLNITNTSYSPTVAQSPVHFTWVSNGTNCFLYNWDKSSSFGAATGNNGSYYFDLGSPNIPQGANTYGYYIKCYDSNHPSTDIENTNTNLASTTESINGVNTTIAWYKINATFSCPNGLVPDPGNGNACVTVQTPPSCSFTDNTNEFVSCSCGDGITSLVIRNTDGSSQTITPPSSPFAWNNLQYRYNTSCGNLPALVRPYTHFLSFNVSAGYIKPGGSIDLNWIVQDPTTTCKIVGVDLKTGTEIFNSESNDYTAVKNSITQSKSSSDTKNFTDGSIMALLNHGIIINNSSRFTASCENLGTYMPGHYQLVRDIYTTNSQER